MNIVSTTKGNALRVVSPGLVGSKIIVADGIFFAITNASGYLCVPCALIAQGFFIDL